MFRVISMILSKWLLTWHWFSWGAWEGAVLSTLCQSTQLPCIQSMSSVRPDQYMSRYFTHPPPRPKSGSPDPLSPARMIKFGGIALDHIVIHVYLQNRWLFWLAQLLQKEIFSWYRWKSRFMSAFSMQRMNQHRPKEWPDLNYSARTIRWRF